MSHNRETIDQSQNSIIRVLKRYSEDNARDHTDKLFGHGLCAGLVVLHAYASTIHILDEKSELPLPKDDLKWLTSFIKKLVHWPVNKPFPVDPEHPFIQDVERFIALIVLLGGYAKNGLTDNQYDLENLVLDTHGRTFKANFSLVEPITFSHLQTQIQQLTSKNTWTTVGSNRHATYFRKHEDDWLSYDPNWPKLNVGVSEKKTGTTIITTKVYTDHLYSPESSHPYLFDFVNYRLAKVHEEKQDLKDEKSEEQSESEKNVLKMLEANESSKNPEILNQKSSVTLLQMAENMRAPTSIFKYYLDHGADPNLASDNKYTVLHQVLVNSKLKKQLELIPLLLERGADPFAKQGSLSRPVDLMLLNFIRFLSANPSIDTPEKKSEHEMHLKLAHLFKMDDAVIKKISTDQIIQCYSKTMDLIAQWSTLYSANANTSSVNAGNQLIIEGIITETQNLMLAGEFDKAYAYIKSKTPGVMNKVNSTELTLFAFSISRSLGTLTTLLLEKIQCKLKMEPSRFNLIAGNFMQLAAGLLNFSMNPLSKKKFDTLFLDLEVYYTFDVFEKDPEAAYIKLKKILHTLKKPDKEGRLILHWAARHGHYTFIKELLTPELEEKSAAECKQQHKTQIDINLRDTKKKSALFYAVLRQDAPLVDLLLTHGAKVDDDYACHPLLQALRTRQFALAKKLSPDCNVAAIQQDFAAFKKLDNLAQRLMAAIDMYYSEIIIKDSKRTALCNTLLSAIHTAYIKALKTGESHDEYQHLLYGEQSKENKDPSFSKNSVIGILNDVIASYRNSKIHRIKLFIQKKEKNQLQDELENALRDCNLCFFINDRGYIADILPTLQLTAAELTAFMKQKFYLLRNELEPAELLATKKIRTILDEYGYSAPFVVHELLQKEIDAALADERLVNDKLRQLFKRFLQFSNDLLELLDKQDKTKIASKKP